jgi:hypothetical protein
VSGNPKTFLCVGPCTHRASKKKHSALHRPSQARRKCEKTIFAKLGPRDYFAPVEPGLVVSAGNQTTSTCIGPGGGCRYSWTRVPQAPSISSTTMVLSKEGCHVWIRTHVSTSRKLHQEKKLRAGNMPSSRAGPVWGLGSTCGRCAHTRSPLRVWSKWL